MKSSTAVPQTADRGNNREAERQEAAKSLLLPGLPAVRTAPDFVVTGGNYDLRWTPHIVAVHINVSYVGAKSLGFDGRLHLRPSYAAVSRVEERARLPAGPDILAATCVAQQWMMRA